MDEDVISDWDKCFSNTGFVRNEDEKQHELLIEAIMDENFLNIKDLLDLTCAKMISQPRIKKKYGCIV